MCGNTIQQWNCELSAFQQHRMLYSNCELSRTELQSSRDAAFNTFHSTGAGTHKHVHGQWQNSATASELSHQSTPARNSQLTQTSAMFRDGRVDKYGYKPSMCNVLKRLETFQEWLVGAPVSALDLARAGFFFLGYGDRVQCFSCGGILMHWEEGDRPFHEHKKHFPNCSFVQREAEDISNSQSLTDSVDGQLLSQLQRIAVDETAQRSQPAYPEMETEERRVATFSSWPQYAAVQPEQLATAGFFYTGQSDNVKCFFCDGGLRNWETGDDPWREHAKWFPRCEFLLQIKGQDYVTAVQESYFRFWLCNEVLFLALPSGLADDIKAKRLDAHLDNQSLVLLWLSFSRHYRIKFITLTTVGGSQCSRSSFSWRFPAGVVGLQDLPALLQSPIVRQVLQMGFDRGLVENLVKSKYLLSGLRYTSVTDLVSDLVQAEEEEQTASQEDRESVQRPVEALDITARSARTPRGNVSGLSAEEQLRQLQEERLCKVCMDKEVSIVYIPCGHLVVCSDCAPSLRRCPICRAVIRGSVRAFMS
ncbi:baculoviral IAP repeat-containing protein 7 [Protopterus annectens]|uniref:baculoviral IAP repeat-containing protein 7 n=1 Tax=Protopterus annectens TaxID=7888 RepID=UPI001CFBB1EB|nr:baculoviral IAP repeat-containing protein 7 [Protopterus annectens]